MATGPQPPRPPVPPQPAGSRSHIVLIVVLVLALIVLIGGVAVVGGLRFLSSAVHVQTAQGGNGEKEIFIRTPLGSLEVNHSVDEASLGLPIYPGATRIKDHDSATVNFRIAEDTRIRVLAGKFQTPDSVDKVCAFYRDRLGDQVTKYTEKTAEGKTVFEIKHDKQQRVVALKSEGDQTVIELVRVSEGREEAN